MSKEQKFELTMNQLYELMTIADKRTQGMLEAFVGVIVAAVDMYPSGDLYHFLAEQTVIFAGCVVDGKMMRIDDIEEFFRDCGFDAEKVKFMIWLYDGIAEAVSKQDAGEQLLLWGAEK